MGIQTEICDNAFTQQNVKDKNLVLKMLSFEDEYGKSNTVKNMYRDELLYHHRDLTITYAIHRYVLDKFGFDTSDESVENYRSIFLNYYNSPSDYDNDVISSVYYMKYNKCVFYDKPLLNIGDVIIDCKLLDINGGDTTLFSILNDSHFEHAFIGAFSNS
jgi:hypothetical protein